MLGASSGAVAALTVPRRTRRTLPCCSPAACRSRSNESSRGQEVREQLPAGVAHPRQAGRAGRCRRTCGPAWAWSEAARAPALVGSPDEVTERIAEYHALGIDEFILPGYPHLEEAYQVGEGLIPVLRRRGL